MTPQRKAKEAKRKDNPKWTGSEYAKIVVHMVFACFAPRRSGSEANVMHFRAM